MKESAIEIKIMIKNKEIRCYVGGEPKEFTKFEEAIGTETAQNILAMFVEFSKIVVDEMKGENHESIQ